MSNTKRQVWRKTIEYIFEVGKHTLGGFGPQVADTFFIFHWADLRFKHHVKQTRLAKSALPELLAIVNKKGPQFRTLYYEGEKSIREMLNLMNQRMKDGELVGFYAKATPETKPLEEYFHDLNEERKDLGIKSRGITPDDPSLEWYRKRIGFFGNQFKFLNKKDYSSDCSIEIGKDFIQIISLRHLQGVHIENPDVAQTMRQVFEMVWQSRPEKIVGASE